MANYTHIYGSLFPDTVMVQKEFLDLDDTCAGVVNSFYSLVSQGKYEQAKLELEAYGEEIFKNRFITAAVINLLFEEIRNAQIFAKQVQQFTFFDTEEPNANTLDIWISANTGL